MCRFDEWVKTILRSRQPKSRTFTFRNHVHLYFEFSWESSCWPWTKSYSHNVTHVLLNSSFVQYAHAPFGQLTSDIDISPCYFISCENRIQRNYSLQGVRVDIYDEFRCQPFRSKPWHGIQKENLCVTWFWNIRYPNLDRIIHLSRHRRYSCHRHQHCRKNSRLYLRTYSLACQSL